MSSLLTGYSGLDPFAKPSHTWQINYTTNSLIKNTLKEATTLLLFLLENNEIQYIIKWHISKGTLLIYSTHK